MCSRSASIFLGCQSLPLGPDPLPPTPPAAGAPRPHIVLFVVDDYGWNNLGAHNPLEGATHTPNFDAAVDEGVLLERHYVFFWCAPTRAAFMTGRMPYHVMESGNYVSGGMNMLPAKLKQVGYATHMVGKCAPPASCAPACPRRASAQPSALIKLSVVRCLRQGTSAGSCNG